MAHAPGVGYSSTPPGSSGFKAAAPVSAPAAAPTASSAPAATSAGSSAPGFSFPTPDLSAISLPGSSPAEKGLIVLGILMLGLFFYSRVTGKPALLGLAGPSAASPAPLNPNTVGGAAPPSPSMLNRIAAASPGKAA